MLLCLGEPLFYIFILFMADAVHEEIIFPFAFFARPRGYICKIYPVLLKNIQHIRQCSGLMRGGKQQSCLIVAGRPGIFLTYDKKSRNVIADIFDIFADNF
jgi:hypothetical protein